VCMLREAPGTFLEMAGGMGITFDEGDLERFGRYLSLLEEANRSFNLTRITEPGAMWERHIFDSLTLLPWLTELGAGSRVADVGSGGGAPGLPLAIALPGLRFTLVESVGKKTGFLREAAAGLGLENVEVVQKRAEDAGRDPALREAHGAGVARALGPLRVAAELVTPLVAPGGVGLFIKGEKAEAEIEEAKGALHRLHTPVLEVRATPTGRVVVLEKGRKTPGAYPRRAGDPKREPL